MKKILSTLVLVTLLVGVVAPAVASAQVGAPDTCKLKRTIFSTTDMPTACVDAGEDSCEKDDVIDVDKCGICCVINTIYNVTDWIFYFMLIATVILVVIGGAMYMMAAGDPEKAGKGKSIIIYGIIGLAIAVFAKAVPSIVKLILAI